MTPRKPKPEPSGSRRPPVRHPPTALATETPPPPPRPSLVRRKTESGLIRFLRRLALVPLDMADSVAAAILRR